MELLTWLIVIALVTIQVLIIALLFHFACPKCSTERTEQQQSEHHARDPSMNYKHTLEM